MKVKAARFSSGSQDIQEFDELQILSEDGQHILFLLNVSDNRLKVVGGDTFKDGRGVILSEDVCVIPKDIHRVIIQRLPYDGGFAKERE